MVSGDKQGDFFFLGLNFRVVLLMFVLISLPFKRSVCSPALVVLGWVVWFGVEADVAINSTSAIKCTNS